MATRRRSRSRARTSARTGAIEFFTRPTQHIAFEILGLLVRLRVELTVLTVLITGYVLLRQYAGLDANWALITEGAVIVLIVAVPASRRFVVRRCWCVISRHRVRACFVQTRTMTHNGKLPYLLWSSPSPVGEALRVWLPAGLSVKHLERVTEELAAACWGRSARISATADQAALIVVEIIRRDPLAQHTTLLPHVVDALPELVTTDGTVIPLPARNRFTPPATPSPIPADQPGGSSPARPGKSRTTTGKPTDRTDAPVAGFGGMDVSDYVDI
jgi:hypothetical protein